MVNIIFDTFNNIENFTPNMIPVSISNQPPDWFIETNDDSIDYYINNNGVICGLKYEPLRQLAQAQCLEQVQYHYQE